MQGSTNAGVFRNVCTAVIFVQNFNVYEGLKEASDFYPSHQIFNV